MKNKFLIIEDNYYKYFSTKHLLEAQLKLKIDDVGIALEKDIPEAIRSVCPDYIIYKPIGGVFDLLQQLQARNVNRRNARIILMLAADPLTCDQVVNYDIITKLNAA